ncbi:MAG: lysylphosphatidylglycerol synthase transmembrane domain-containing protein [Acholeplasmataceae bacterium]
MQKHTRKRLLNILFIVINVVVVWIIARNAFSKDTTMRFSNIFALWKSHVVYVLMAFLMPIIALITEGLKYFHMLYYTTGEKRFLLSIKTAIIGKYYDNITPLGSGGQAAQVIYLYQNGVPSAKAGGVTISAFSMMQIAFSLIAFIVFIFFGHYITTPGIKIAAYFGSVFAIFIPFLVIIFSVLPKVTSKFIFSVLKILKALKLIYDPIQKMKHVMSFLERFKHNLHLISQSKRVLISTFLLSVVYQIAIFSIPYFVLKGSGVDVTYIELFVLTVFVYNAIAFIPTPGNSGGAEISFTIIFSMVSGGLLFWTMLLWRFMSYYLLIFLGLCVMFYDSVIKR